MKAYNLYNYIGGEGSLPPQPQISEIITSPDGDNIKITGFKFQNVSSVSSFSVPNMINGKKVSKIDNSAFANNMGNIRKIVIPFEFDWAQPDKTILFAPSITEIEMTQPIQKNGKFPPLQIPTSGESANLSKITLGGNIIEILGGGYTRTVPTTYDPLFNVSLFNNVTSVGRSAFKNCTLLGNEFTNLVSISESGFSYANFIRGIVNMPNLITLNNFAFSGTNLIEGRFPNLTSIVGYRVFENNYNLTTLYFNNLKSILESNNFSNLPKLEHIYTNSDNVELLKTQFNNIRKPELAALVEADPSGDK